MKKTCINCDYRDQEDECCWCSSSLNYSQEVDEDTIICEFFEGDGCDEEES